MQLCGLTTFNFFEYRRMLSLLGDCSKIQNDNLSHWSDSFSPGMRMTSLALEVAEWPILLAGLTGMYNGIEIGHPIFATLFCNLVGVL